MCQNIFMSRAGIIIKYIMWLVLEAEVMPVLIGYMPFEGIIFQQFPQANYMPAKTKQIKSHIINNLLTLNVQSLWENLKPWPCQPNLGLIFDFPINTLLLVNIK